LSIRGGARRGAGRKPAWKTPLCSFVVDNTRRIAAVKMRDKQQKLLVAWKPEYADVEELQSRLRPRSRFNGEILEDIRYHFDPTTPGSPALPRYIPAVELSPLEWGKIYAEIAVAASLHFGRTISHRQVKRCIAEWLKFERSLSVAD